jgi:hypothetical protein
MLVRNCPFFGQPRSGQQGTEFVTSDGFERNFGGITPFSIAPSLGVQMENSGVMLPKFHSDSSLIINSVSGRPLLGGFRTYPFLYMSVHD